MALWHFIAFYDTCNSAESNFCILDSDIYRGGSTDSIVHMGISLSKLRPLLSKIAEAVHKLIEYVNVWVFPRL